MKQVSTTIERNANQLVAFGLALLLFGVSLNFFTAKSPGTSLPAAEEFGPRPELVLQRGHSLGITCAAFAPDGKWLASGGADNAILIWQVSSSRHLRTLTGHKGYIRSLAISLSGDLMASGSSDRSVKIWNVATGQENFTLTGFGAPIEALAFSTDGQKLASGTSEKKIKIWDVATGTELKSLEKDRAASGVLTFSPNGDLLASSTDAEIIVWETKTWKKRHAVRRHSEKITAISFSKNSDWMASSGADGAIMIWRYGSDRERFTLLGNSTSVVALAFDLNGFVIATHGDGAVECWDPNSGKKKWSRPGNENSELFVFGSLSPEATTLASGNGDRILRLRSVTTGKISAILESHSTAVNSIAFSPDGRWFAAAANDSSIRLWQMATGRELPRLTGHTGYATTIAFSPDSQWIASGTRSGEVKIWNVANTRLAFSLPPRSSGINVVTFSPDGQYLVTGGMERDLEIWDLNSKQARVFKGHTEEITSAVFVPGGRELISAGRDKVLRVWDWETGKEIRSFDNLGAEINSLSVSPNGKLLAAANADHSVRVWNIADSVPLRTLSGHTGEVLSVSFSRDSQLLASGGGNGAMIWEAESGKKLRQLTGSAESVTSIAFNKDGRWVFCGSNDGSITVWSSAAGTLMATMLSMPNSDDWLVTAPNGLFDGAPESWNLMLWRFNSQTFDVMPIEAFFNEFYYPALLADILADKNPPAATDITQKDRRQPLIAIRVNQNVDNSANRNLDVELEVTAASPDKTHKVPSGAKDLRLFRNGLLVKTWIGDLLETTGTRTLKATIPIVTGENRISAYAFNRDNIKSADATLLITGANSLKRKGSVYLFVIGVADYENTQYNLRYPVADANEMAALLKAQQERFGRYSPIVTIALTNAQATKNNILLALNRLAGSTSEPLPLDAPPSLSVIKPAQPEDAVVVYFSGHGMAVRDRFYLIPYDIGFKGRREQLDRAGVTTIEKHGISDEELVEALRPMDADQLLLIIDACNSGQAIESQDKRYGPMNTRGLAQLAYEKGIYVLTASQSMEVAFEAEALKHSYLAYALLEEGIKSGSADGNQDGDIFLKEWFDYANSRVPQIRKMRYQQSKQLVEDEPDEQKVQRPRIFYTREAGAKRFLVARRVN